MYSMEYGHRIYKIIPVPVESLYFETSNGRFIFQSLNALFKFIPNPEIRRNFFSKFSRKQLPSKSVLCMTKLENH